MHDSQSHRPLMPNREADTPVPTHGVASTSAGIVLALALATLGRLALDPVIGKGLPYTVYLLAVMALAWWRGPLAALVTAAGGLVIGTLLFLQAEPWTTTVARAMIYAAVAAALGWLAIHAGTQYRHAREEDIRLRQSEADFRHLAETVPQIIWVTDAQGTVTYMNSRWQTYTGVSAAQALGDGWASHVHPDDSAGVQQAFQASMATLQPLEYEIRLRMADEAYRWFAVRARPVRDTRGQVAAWYGSNTDVHDLKRVTEALLEADRRKDEFLATLAHELRNPLAPLRSGVHLLRVAGHDADVVARTQVRMERQVTHLTRLVDDLLDVSRITRGTIVLQRDRVDLRDVLRDAVETSRPLLEQRRHHFESRMPDAPAMAQADAGRITQAVANLLNNAARYTEPGGHIVLRLEREPACHAIVVEDNGCGIPAHMLDSVFELFTQVPGDGTAPEGLGIGLHVVRKVADLHGGSVHAQSPGKGRGSRFVLRLPADDGEAAPTT